jgi:hypothetical protein
MLPVLVVAAAGTGAAAAVVTTRRRRSLNSKPQRRFKLRLADNSDAPFAHLQACSTSSTADASTATATGCSDPPDFTGAGKDTLSSEKQPTQQQQQQHQEEAAHPYAEQIAAVLQHPHYPNFSTTVTPSAPDKDSNSSSAARHHLYNHCHHHHDHRHHHHQQQTEQASSGEALSLSQPPPPLSSTPWLWVDTPRRLQQMLRELEGVKCIALDTEHNSQRSYLGMLCLLQLSTGESMA